MKIAVIVRDQKESKRVQVALFSIGVFWRGRWCNEFQTSPVESYDNNACIDISGERLSYSPVDWFNKRGYHIVSTDTFFKDVFPNMEVERAAHK